MPKLLLWQKEIIEREPSLTTLELLDVVVEAQGIISSDQTESQIYNRTAWEFTYLYEKLKQRILGAGEK